jgi:hypothetical protein
MNDIKVKVSWDFGQVVWLKVEPEMKGMITGFVLRKDSPVAYFVTWNDAEETLHFAMELTDEKPADFGKDE